MIFYRKMYLTTLILFLLVSKSKENGENPSRLIEFCKSLYIPLYNCTCKISPVVCEIAQFQENVQLKNITMKPVFERHGQITSVYASIAIFSSILGLVGNSAVIFMAYQKRRNLSPCKLHVAQLALVNFVFSMLQVINVGPLYWSNKWIYGEYVCKLVKGTLEMGSLLSSGYFQLISVERYFYIVPTFNIEKVKGFCQRFRHVLVGCNLLFVTATITPLLHGLGIEPHTQRCVNFAGSHKWMGGPYTWFTFVVFSLQPICLISGSLRNGEEVVG